MMRGISKPPVNPEMFLKNENQTRPHRRLLRLANLVLGVGRTDNPQATLAANNLAAFATALDGTSDFHDQPCPFLSGPC
jgi:hypothetical protein